MVWEIAWKLKHKTVCFVFFIVVFYLQIFKALEESADSVKKQSRFRYGSLNKIPLPIKRLWEHCFVKLEFFLPVFFCYVLMHSYVVLRKLIRILPKCWLFLTLLSEKAAIPKRKKNLKLSQLVQYKKAGKPSKSLHNKIEGMIKVFDFICWII